MEAQLTYTGRFHQNADQLRNEKAMIEAAKANVRNFEPLYTKYYEAIFLFIFRRTEGMEVARELTSEVFFRALSKLDTYEDRGVPFSAWLYRIALNIIHNNHRAHKTKRIITLEDHHLKAYCEEAGWSDDRMEMVEAAILTLDEEETSYMELRFFEERPFREIAAIMNTSEAGAKMKMQRILQKIRKRIGTDKAMKS
ncbi:MAG: sigma-70 family RNA polymerase sigma factor, partial [Flavobacteriales bacterium]|nr:sigma-70 family RNA polymerase sigma factor [Flavobacteriales bacterium]